MINHTTDATDERLIRPARHGWRLACVVFLVVSLLALSAGAFWEFFLPAHRTAIDSNPPALQALISVQAVFLIMFWPLLVVRNRRIGGHGWHGQVEDLAVAGDNTAKLHSVPLDRATHQLRFLFRAVVEYTVFLAVSIPLYVVAAYLSDATATDVIRSACYLSAVATGALGLGLWVRTGRTAIITAVTLAGALIALGAPVMYYLLAEMTDAGSVGWLWWASPMTCAFDVAVAGGINWYPTPLWAWALWPVVGVVLFLVHELKKKK